MDQSLKKKKCQILSRYIFFSAWKLLQKTAKGAASLSSNSESIMCQTHIKSDKLLHIASSSLEICTLVELPVISSESNIYAEVMERV